MKILIYTLALISAFFVFTAYAGDGIPEGFPDNKVWPGVPPESTIYYTCTTQSNGQHTIKVEKPETCIDWAYEKRKADPAMSSYCKLERVGTPTQQNGYFSQQLQLFSSNSNGCIVRAGYDAFAVTWSQLPPDPPNCPTKTNPKHTYSWPLGTDQIESCHISKDVEPEPEPEPEPDDDSCNEFGDNSFLPPQSGLDVPAGGSVCYTTSTGKQCKYTASDFGDGYNQTGQTCSGEEPDYGQPQTPPDEGCATVGSLEFFAVCPVDPNEACNPLLINNDTVYQCPTGCGSINGEYVCTYPDENANGIPDKDENPDNPDNPDDPDPNNPNPDNPNPDNPVDMTQTNNLLSGLGNKVDGVGNKIDGLGSKLDSVGDSLGGKLDGIKLGVDGSNELLGSMNSKLAGIALNQEVANQLTGDMLNNTGTISENTGITAGNTGDILEAITDVDTADTFNPDASASFYESTYENGFEGVWSEKSEAFKQTETFLFLDQFKFNSSGQEPDTDICFNLGVQMNFGCAELPIATPQLLAILKVFILITAAFLCRALIFGG